MLLAVLFGSKHPFGLHILRTVCRIITPKIQSMSHRWARRLQYPNFLR